MNKHTGCRLPYDRSSPQQTLGYFQSEQRERTVLCEAEAAWQIYASHAPLGKRALVGGLVGLTDCSTEV